MTPLRSICTSACSLQPAADSRASQLRRGATLTPPDTTSSGSSSQESPTVQMQVCEEEEDEEKAAQPPKQIQSFSQGIPEPGWKCGKRFLHLFFFLVLQSLNTF